MKDRIYVCHTFYHVYITVIKELNLPIKDRNKATLLLSTMSNDFGSMTERAEKCGLFEAVYMFDEIKDTRLPDVMADHKDNGNIILNLYHRIKYTRELGKAQEANVPVDFKQYKDIYVFCDSDPIGYYLNYKHIYYHAIEDGLDTVVYCDDARFGNRGHFKIKAFMAKHGLIFIENGYSKYCIDMEVNDVSAIKYKNDAYIEVPRKKLIENVSKEDIHLLIELFMDDPQSLIRQMKEAPVDKKKVMILSDPVCDLETRKRIMRDIIEKYGKNATVFIKPHPRDALDYTTEDFSDCIVIKGRFPMEMMNYLDEFHMDTVVSILTVVDEIEFADERIKLGNDFMDIYENPKLHRQNEQI
jgi:hypothetical protein